MILISLCSWELDIRKLYFNTSLSTISIVGFRLRWLWSLWCYTFCSGWALCTWRTILDWIHVYSLSKVRKELVLRTRVVHIVHWYNTDIAIHKPRCFRLGERLPGWKGICRTKHTEAKSGTERVGEKDGERILSMEWGQTRWSGGVVTIPYGCDDARHELLVEGGDSDGEDNDSKVTNQKLIWSTIHSILCKLASLDHKLRSSHPHFSNIIMNRLFQFYFPSTHSGQSISSQ